MTNNAIRNTGQIALLALLCATTAGGFLGLSPAQGFLNPALARIVVFHVPCSLVATVAAAHASWYAALYLWKRDLADDAKSRTAFALALLLWVLTVVTGSIFAKVQWGAYWNWDPKQTAILLLLLINAAYFILRAAVSDPRRAATLSAAYALFALVALPFLTYILPNATPDTLHPKGVITTKQGLDAAYKIVLWGQTLGLTLVYAWAWQIGMRLELLTLRADARARTLSLRRPRAWSR